MQFFRATRPIIDGERAATIKRKEVLQKAPVDWKEFQNVHEIFKCIRLATLNRRYSLCVCVCVGLAYYWEEKKIFFLLCKCILVRWVRWWASWPWWILMTWAIIQGRVSVEIWLKNSVCIPPHWYRQPVTYRELRFSYWWLEFRMRVRSSYSSLLVWEMIE